MFPGNPAIRDVREPGVDEWAVVPASTPWRPDWYEVQAPFLSGSSLAFGVRTRETAHEVADYLNAYHADYTDGAPVPDLSEFGVEACGE